MSPFFALDQIHKDLHEGFLADLNRVLSHGQFILGEEVAQFESKMAALLGCHHAIGVSSGTDALMLAMTALGIGPGDEVITTPFSFFATAGTIDRMGATPVFADIDPETFNLCPKRTQDALTDKTRAILPVHLFGHPADMAPLLSLGKTHGVSIIEDAAQGMGTRYHGQAAGTLGDIGTFSFFPTKNLGALGDAGLVTTSRDDLVDKIRMGRVHGAKVKHHHEFVGGNYRLDALQAAFLQRKLTFLDRWQAERQKTAGIYLGRLAPWHDKGVLRLPVQRKACHHTYHQFVLSVPSHRDELQAHLKAKGIGSAIYYPSPLHLQPCFDDLGYAKGRFPNAEQACQDVLALPIYPGMTPDQRQATLDGVISFFA